MDFRTKPFTAAIVCTLAALLLLNTPVCAEEKIQPAEKTKDHKIVRLHYISGLNPKVVTVKQGATVVWINESKSLAEIYFTDKQVSTACKNPTHFVVNVDGVFVSDKIPTGAVASLCFIEKGEFNYIVLRDPRTTDPTLTRPDLLEGKVIVE